MEPLELWKSAGSHLPICFKFICIYICLYLEVPNIFATAVFVSADGAFSS